MSARAEFRVRAADGTVTTVPMDNIPNVADDGTFTDDEKNRARTYISQHYALPAGAQIDGDSFILTETLNGVAFPPSPPISFNGVLARPAGSPSVTIPPPTDIRPIGPPGALVGRSYPNGSDGAPQLWTRTSATAGWRPLATTPGASPRPQVAAPGANHGPRPVQSVQGANPNPPPSGSAVPRPRPAGSAHPANHGNRPNPRPVTNNGRRVIRD